MAEPQQALSRTFPVKPKLKAKSKKPSKTPESKYWSSFKSHTIPNLISSITSLSFSPATPHHFAAAYSTSLTLFNSKTLEPISSISSFKDVVSCASFRSDGLLIAASDHSGLVQVFDVKTRTALRKLRGHTRPVRLVRYPRSDKLHLFSGGDDAVVKYWDVAAESGVVEFRGHKDYVRCGDGSPASSELFATGSYDHTVKVWDVRVSNSDAAMKINHGKPVEDVIFLPSGGLIATAGGNCVKIWDVIGGGKLLYSMENHNKTVTSICVGKIGRDGGEGSQHRFYQLGSRLIEPQRRVLRPSYFRYFHRSQGEKPSEGDYLITRPKKVKIAEHDKLLKKFRHKDAFVSALSGKNPENVVAVMEELVARKKLLKCVSNLDTEELGLLLAFLHRHSTVPRYAGLLMGLTKKVVQMRAEDIIASDVLKGHIRNLKRSVEEEVRIQQSLQEIQGIISPLLRIAGRR
ncbi:unnamed protein product, partial [Vitis vinifera]